MDLFSQYKEQGLEYEPSFPFREGEDEDYRALRNPGCNFFCNRMSLENLRTFPRLLQEFSLKT